MTDYMLSTWEFWAIVVVAAIFIGVMIYLIRKY